MFCGHLDVIKRKILYFGSSLQSTIIVLFQNFSNPRKHTKTYKVMDFTSSKTSSQSTEKAFVISKSLLKFVYLTQNLLKYSKSSFLPKKTPNPTIKELQGGKIREIQGPLWLHLEKRRHPLARWLRLIEVTTASFGYENALCPSQRHWHCQRGGNCSVYREIFWGGVISVGR